MALTSSPIGTITLGPNLGRSTRLDTCAIAASAAIMGRKARPVLTGLNPSVSCM